jgi:hypothetical protein
MAVLFQAAQGLPLWTIKDGQLSRSFVAKSFAAVSAPLLRAVPAFELAISQAIFHSKGSVASGQGQGLTSLLLRSDRRWSSSMQWVRSRSTKG